MENLRGGGRAGRRRDAAAGAVLVPGIGCKVLRLELLCACHELGLGGGRQLIPALAQIFAHGRVMCVGVQPFVLQG